MSEESKTPNIIITSISDDSNSNSSLSVSDLEDDSEYDSNSSTVETNTHDNNVTVEEMIAAATKNIPQHSQINIESSTDISIGHHTIIQGPVIIRSTKNAVADILRNEVNKNEKNYLKNEELLPDIVIRSGTKSQHIYCDENKFNKNESSSLYTNQWIQFINARKKKFIVLSILLIILLSLCALFPLIFVSSKDNF